MESNLSNEIREQTTLDGEGLGTDPAPAVESFSTQAGITNEQLRAVQRVIEAEIQKTKSRVLSRVLSTQA